MKSCWLFLLLTAFSIAGCSPKARQHSGNEPSSTTGKAVYFRDAGANVAATLNCPAKVFPTHYRLLVTDYPALRKRLLTRGSTAGSLNLDTIVLSVPLPNGTFEDFVITQIQVLPPELADKYPDIKTYYGKSVAYAEDNIRLDIAPKGISMMILSTRGTIMIDPWCSTDSVHIISYYKKDLPEGGKQEFEK